MVIAPNAPAPSFRLTSHTGESWNLADALEKGPVALVFFPFAFSGICQGELCELRDNIAVFRDAAVQLVGISVDSKFALRAWAETQNFEFPLLSDFWPHGQVARNYGVFSEESGMALRATVLIDRGGVVRASFETAVGEPRSLAAYREAIATLAG